ncbi:hypothetical protein CERSUDRAFT_112167 [Gelatoporia subvermispora B]|uniref:Small ribosomal subunit protein mS41 n=1 Tax=Ceriporiopsis subvermispora (strain B) TaxID=914234 RepID=M2QSC4_CERS8|nr:hypothetical protein CERSUDRAFT_112167 [Gelatoporia subvermispora B]
MSLTTLSQRIAAFAPRFSFSRALQNRALARPVPSPQAGSIASPEDFLKSIGRSADTKVSVESWEQLWHLNGAALKKAGVAVRDRRYILWSMEKYRQGEQPAEFAHPPMPKRTIRGRGPAVQNGKRIRSRRLKQ